MKIIVNNLTGEGRTYQFDVEPSTTIKQLKKLLCEKAGDNVKNILNMLLTFDKDILDEDEATLLSYGMEEDSQLRLSDLNMQARNFGVIGLRFVDVSNSTGLKRREWCKDAPRWRRTRCGLCLEGQCNNSECEAYNRTVIMPMGYTKFDVLLDPSDTKTVCPLCKTYVQPTNCGFNNCWWKFYGKKQDESNDKKPPQNCSSDWNQVDDAYHYFDQLKSGIAIWRQLVIEAVKTKPVQ
ncbi:unnamed protein product [Rotaria sp. Silwood1]|nr:unnamed protein product [Rotaria sp. Silwood1]CAF3378165.1 unnamed protein product [Rotaria sp. Silwood1]CAF4741653.1 unnamed protein product [Rotaria sp. Silwood1]